MEKLQQPWPLVKPLRLTATKLVSFRRKNGQRHNAFTFYGIRGVIICAPESAWKSKLTT